MYLTKTLMYLRLCVKGINIGGFDRALDFSRGSLSLNSPFTVRAAIHAF